MDTFEKWASIGFVTILVLVEYSLQFVTVEKQASAETVTILVLVEYSLQYDYDNNFNIDFLSHNPCFSRILFAIEIDDIVVKTKNKSQSLF